MYNALLLDLVNTKIISAKLNVRDRKLEIAFLFISKQLLFLQSKNKTLLSTSHFPGAVLLYFNKLMSFLPVLPATTENHRKTVRVAIVINEISKAAAPGLTYPLCESIFACSTDRALTKYK